MKAVQLAVVLLIVCISSALALRCKRCVPRSSAPCTNTVETCQGQEDVCASVTCVYSIRTLHFKRCMKKSDTFILQADPHCTVFTCTTDQCN